MNKFLKWLLVGLGLVVVLFAIAAVVLPTVIDPNDYKDEISAAVLKKTGRDLVIGGEIKWSVFPSLGLELSDVTMGNRQGFGDQPMLDIGEVGVSLKLMPLFKRRIEINEVSMADVSINLQRNADGRTNWEDLSQSGQVNSDESSTSTASSSDQGMGIENFVISGIEVSNASVSLKDVDQTTELKDFGLVASGISLGRPFGLKGGFSVNLPEHQIAGDVKFDGLIQTSTDAKRYGITGLKLSFTGHQGEQGEQKALDVTVSTNADVDLASDQAKLSDFVFQLHDLIASGELNVTSVLNDRTFVGHLKIAEFNPKSLMKDLGLEVPQTTNSEAMTRLQADMKFTGSSSSADMQDLVVKFDESTFNGKLKIDGFDQPHLAFDFQVDQLNLDDYSSAETPASGSGAENESADLSVDDFRGFTGGGEFRIGHLVVAGLTATEANVTMKSNGKGIRFFPINAKVYGGQHEGEIKIDASGALPILSVNQGMTGVQAEQLLQDLSGSARLQGTGDFFLQVSTDLTNSSTTMQSLSGDIGMSIQNGAIVGIDIADTRSTVQAAMGKQKEVSGETGQDKKTEFAELSMTGIIKQGVMSSDDLLMESTLLKASGKGTFNLVEETVDYVLKPVLIGEKVDQSLADLSGTPIPINITGNLYEPDIMVDIVAAIAGSQSELINQKKNELIGKYLGGKEDSDAGAEKDGAEKDSDEKAEDQVNSLLKGLLGGKKKKDDKDSGGY